MQRYSSFCSLDSNDKYLISNQVKKWRRKCKHCGDSSQNMPKDDNESDIGVKSKSSNFENIRLQRNIPRLIN